MEELIRICNRGVVRGNSLGGRGGGGAYKDL